MPKSKNYRRIETTNRPIRNITANKITIIAAHGTLIAAEINNPATPHTIEIIIDSNTIILNRGANISAIIWGNVSIDIKSIMPTRRIVSTIHTATMAVIKYEITFTGICDTRAKSLSKAHAII